MENTKKNVSSSTARLTPEAIDSFHVEPLSSLCPRTPQTSHIVLIQGSLIQNAVHKEQPRNFCLKQARHVQVNHEKTQPLRRKAKLRENQVDFKKPDPNCGSLADSSKA